MVFPHPFKLVLRLVSLIYRTPPPPLFSSSILLWFFAIYYKLLLLCLVSPSILLQKTLNSGTLRFKALLPSSVQWSSDYPSLLSSLWFPYPLKKPFLYTYLSPDIIHSASPPLRPSRHYYPLKFLVTFPEPLLGFLFHSHALPFLSGTPSLPLPKPALPSSLY